MSPTWNISWIFWNLQLLEVRGIAEIIVGNMHLTEEVLKQLGIVQEYLAGYPRNQDSQNQKKKKDTWAKKVFFLVKAMPEVLYLHIHT